MPLKPLVKRLLRPFNLALSTRAYGANFRVPILRGVGGSHWRGTEAWMVDALGRLLRANEGTGLIDVGANIGQTLLKAKSIDRAIRYVGFEPNPFCVQYIDELVKLNQFDACTIVPVALSSRPGLVDFHAVSEADSAGSMVDGLRSGQKLLRKRHVAMLRFDDIAQQLALDEAPAVVKIDVEGGELEVIAGMQRHLARRRPWVICEVLHADSKERMPFTHGRNRALMAMLSEAGYATFRLVKDGCERRVDALAAVSEFPDEVFDHRSSPALCDYLFVPQEKVPDTVRMFGRAPVAVGDRRFGTPAAAS